MEKLIVLFAFGTYVQLRQAEDVEDEIYNISPIDNPVCSMSRTIRATGKLHEWTQDTLKATVQNAVLEGAAAGADISVAVTELQNYCQIMTKVAEITGTLEEVKKYGRDSEMAYQLELRYGELANDEESAVIGDAGGTGRQVAVAGSAVVAREMASFYAQVDASVIVDSATSNAGGVITTTAMLETDLLAAHLATYTNGGNPGYAVTDPRTAGFFAAFALSAGRTRDFGTERVLVHVIDLYVSTYGELDVILDRNMTQTNSAIALLDFNYLATPVLRPTRDWEIAKQGDSDKRQILRESTFAVLNTRAHALVDNIPATLTVS
tara:strand:+ start:2272 stop:3237 length:966 start_codon:yes stop_codon:yes gene_type:complete